MDHRSHRYEISRPQPVVSPTPAPPPPPPPPPPPLPSLAALAQHATISDYQGPEQILWPSALPRPLSDIRELSEPSLMDNVIKHPNTFLRHARSESRANRNGRSNSPKRTQSSKATSKATTVTYPSTLPQEAASSSYSSTPEQSTFYSIPQSSVPRRSSSYKYRQAPRAYNIDSHHSKLPPSTLLAPQPHIIYRIPNRGGSHSPVKEAGLRLDPITSDTARRIPSQTHVRSPHPADILDFPSFKHPRVKLELQVSAPLFVGGGSVEGFVKVTVDDNERVRHRRSISMGAISVDLIGFEEVEGSRRASFIAVGTDVVDSKHPPPPRMIQPTSPLFADDKFWSLMPSCSALPFMISLPLDTGPPPFQSKHASIRFMLAVTAFLRDAGKHYRVRTSQDVHVLPTYDPEKALTSLPSPLIACDELSMSRHSGHESIKITAGLHRQIWVSGSSVFVDVHIANKCRKPVRRLELTLERNILCYKHAAVPVMERSADQARIFESNEHSILARSLFKASSTGWNGVEPHTSHTRTCELELPRGHGTVRCGKYFEVRFFLNVTASLSNSKLVSVQLPVILIHMNSLDVVPNSVAQVAAAIEERKLHRHACRSRSRRAAGLHERQRSVSSPARTTNLRRKPSYAQGRAFAAPRQQSLDRQKEHRADIEELQHTVDLSPRKFPPSPAVKGFTVKTVGSNVNLGTLRLGSASTETLGVLGGISYEVSSPQHPSRHIESDSGGLRGRLRRVGSLDSVRSLRSAASNTSRRMAENFRPRKATAWNQQQIAPQTLGLMTTTRKVSIDPPPSERSTTAMSLREKLDRSRFEFKAVRRKASGGLKERSMNWWESRKGNRDREKEESYERAGWI